MQPIEFHWGAAVAVAVVALAAVVVSGSSKDACQRSTPIATSPPMVWIAVNREGSVPGALCPLDSLALAQKHRVSAQELQLKAKGDRWEEAFDSVVVWYEVLSVPSSALSQGRWQIGVSYWTATASVDNMRYGPQWLWLLQATPTQAGPS